MIRPRRRTSHELSHRSVFFSGAFRIGPRPLRVGSSIAVCRALLKGDAAERAPVRQMARIRSEDTIRFYALLLHETGIIKPNPNKLIAEGANLRFLNGVKPELKA